MPMFSQMLLEAAKNAATGVPALRTWRLRRPRAGETYNGEVAQLRRYAFQSLDIIRSSGVELEGKTVVEIGPGDFLTSGMALLAAGATKYVSMDRFVGDYGRLEGKSWYSGIKDAWSSQYPEIPWPAWLAAENFPEAYVPDRVQALDTPVEQAPSLGKFDVVCSFQVAEHVSDIDLFASANRSLLRPGGIAVHRVDFGPHGSWLNHADPLAFLRCSDRTWRAMGSARGTPNRSRVHELTEAFHRVGLAVELRGIERYDRSVIQWEKLGQRFQSMPEESVLTHTAILLVRG